MQASVHRRLPCDPMTSGSPTRTRGLLAALVLLGGLLTGCGGGEPERAETSETEHNDADVEFATDLLQQHATTMGLLDQARGADLDPEVTALVEEVRDSHGTRSEEVVALFRDWHEDIPETSRDHVNASHGHGDHGDEEAPDQDELLADLAAQHEEALDLVTAEVTDGRYADAVQLAESAESDLEAELTQIEELRD